MKGFDLKSRAFNWHTDRFIKGKYRDYVFPEYLEIIQYIWNTSVNVETLTGFESIVQVAKKSIIGFSDFDSLPVLFFEVRDLLIARFNRVANDLK